MLTLIKQVQAVVSDHSIIFVFHDVNDPEPLTLSYSMALMWSRCLTLLLIQKSYRMKISMNTD